MPINLHSEPLYIPYHISNLLATREYKTWIVGGWCRDNLLGIPSKDIDLCTDAEPVEMLILLPKSHQLSSYIQGKLTVHPVGLEFGTILAHVEMDLEGKYYQDVEITTLRREISHNGRHCEVEFTKDINLDLARRDFTINAMARDFRNIDVLIDPYNGEEDLKNRIIRAVGDPNIRFQEDYLRIIRACRFTGYGDGFSIEPKTWAAMIKHKEGIESLSKERIRNEILAMMKTNHPSKCINALKNAGLLEYTIPPLVDCIGVDQNTYHHDTVINHCIATCQAASKDRPLLRLAALLHDVGKPATKTIDEETGDTHFYNHEVNGAELVYNWAKQFKFTSKDCEYLSTIVRHHMFHFVLGETKKSTIKKWMSKTKDLYWDVIELRKADRAGNKAKEGKPLITYHLQGLIDKVKEIEEHKEPLRVTDLNFSGKDLIALGLEPGPVFGEILNQLLERVIEDADLNTYEKLIELAREILAKQQSG